MDAMVISLHLAYNSNSFTDAIFKAASWGGDSDTFGAITG